MSFISSFRASAAWLRFVQSLNVIAASLFGGVLLLNQAYPQALTQFGGKLPTWAQILGGIAWFALVHYSLNRAKPRA